MFKPRISEFDTTAGGAVCNTCSYDEYIFYEYPNNAEKRTVKSVHSYKDKKY